jgi:type I restriction enzyme S subunit
MGSEWNTIVLGDACTKIGSGATPRGGQSVYLDHGDTALIRSQNIYNDGFRREGLAYITEEHAAQLINVELEPSDVLLNITGDSVARCCQVDDEILPARVNQHVAIIRPDPTVLDPSFLRYFLVSPSMQSKMLSWGGSGGTRNALTKGMIESFQIPAPDITEQRAIAAVLGSLDDKIELNRRLNRTLEAMARALFKSWFVDFDPVRARMEGRETGLPEEIEALFPEEMEEGRPRGWGVKSLDEIAAYLNGLALQKYPSKGYEFLPVIKIAQLKKGNTEGADRASLDIPSEYIIEDGDILFSWSGSLEVVIWCGGRGALNQHLFKVTSENYPKWYYYLWTKEHLTDFQEIAAGKATTMGHIQRKHLTQAHALVPSPELLDVMDSIMSPLIERIIASNVESRTLAALRDGLLPRLMSGEARVPLAEEAADAL